MYATPTLCYWFLADKKGDKKSDKAETYDGNVYKIYRAILEKLLGLRVGFVVLMVVLLVVSVMGLAKIPKQMMPYSDRNQFLVYLDLPAGTHIDETEKVSPPLIIRRMASGTHMQKVTKNILQC